jgi:hypothetical protein
MHYKPSPIALFREAFKKKGFELVNITPLCEFKLGISGWCNDFNEPEEECYHGQIRYRGDTIANILGNKIEVLDDKLYAIFFNKDCLGDDFILYRKVKL